VKISFKGDYALKIILDLALNYQRGLVQISDIAKRQDIPLKYLEQILLVLKGAGYVRSKRGPKGGFWLAKHPREITLGEIIRLMQGPTSPITCVSTSAYSKCRDEPKCPFRGLWLEIKEAINRVVDYTTFEDMVKRVIQMQDKESLVYMI